MNNEGRYLHRVFQIDTNRINSRSKLPAMNQLEKWHKNRVILLEMAEIAQDEAVFGDDPQRTEKALIYTHSKSLATTNEEQVLLRKIEAILFPKGINTNNQKNDVEIVFAAKKYCGYLITSDGASKAQPGGILGHKKELQQLGINVMSDIEAVDYIRTLIIARDIIAKDNSERTGEPLPLWVNKD